MSTWRIGFDRRRGKLTAEALRTRSKEFLMKRYSISVNSGSLREIRLVAKLFPVFFKLNPLKDEDQELF
jgi:hypothetical protein